MPAEDGLKRSQETESLVKRLAGPSSGKAGLAKDQSEINRIITEASKGSKFYDNEKKKDKEVTVRIEKILKERDESLKTADIRKIESSVDQLIAELEVQRDLTQIIVHVDMDAFYANVELLDNPKLHGKPFAVGKGVLSTASYEARFIAKKLCPDLIFLPNRFSRYLEMSKKIMDIFHRYDPDMCPAGCDEGYLNITPYCEEHSMAAEDCVREMRETVFRETQLTVSAGIAPNKMLAKICSDKNKPNGQFQLEFKPEAIKAFMHDLSIRKVPGIGRVNERMLDAIGIKTCGDIYQQRAVVTLMDKRFGLVFLCRTYLGIASNVVQPHEREERKSIGAERTFSTLDSKEKIFEKLTEVSVELEKDMEETGWVGRTVTLKFKLDTYQVFTRAKSIDHWVSKKEELFAIGKELLLPEFPLKIRLIGLRVTKLKDLRAKDDPTNGIKRFFQSSKENEPRKKAKLEDDADLHDVMEDAMPGFHEHDETDYQVDDNDGDDIVEITNMDKDVTRSRPPHSTSNAQASSSKLESVPARARSTSAAPRLRGDKGKSILTSIKASTQECPICSKVLEIDNDSLNAHIDFCLSRSAIMEAQVETNKLVKKPYVGWPRQEFSRKVDTKPPSSRGRQPSKRGR
ncbi:hypothetical protein NLJ89_g6194 [Agrocybe chaxingu]|uniref:DNA polymerase kappa n=1 Tax=Agrocybe chaxingu TaxID=84603 RepID=A0A9W8K171_9AGAR|nr:hypothetical protein NLJ89_g6194 [Agrocybe chaxingu]